MRPLKIFILLSFGFLISGCSHFIFCGYTSDVRVVHQLPCSNCKYLGVISPDLYCPVETYRYKLQCAATHCGGNTVLLQNVGTRNRLAYAIYNCPPPNVRDIPCNSKTDISTCCGVPAPIRQ